MEKIIIDKKYRKAKEEALKAHVIEITRFEFPLTLDDLKKRRKIINAYNERFMKPKDEVPEDEVIFSD